MHEMSLALEVCSIAERHVPKEQLTQIVEVGLEVGDAAGIEADNLEFWLETLLANPPFKAARPVIKRVSGDVLRVSYLEVDDGSPDD
jgi:Zn finger protein HypA/HybF involved in hydrogenase expression